LTALTSLTVKRGFALTAKREIPLVIEYLPVDDLIPYAGNARKHTKAQIAKIAASIERFGFDNPILLDAGGIVVAGHGRLLAAKRLGIGVVRCADH
jgi:ParB-like chromosome segregation protein Spo0J